MLFKYPIFPAVWKCFCKLPCQAYLYKLSPRFWIALAVLRNTDGIINTYRSGVQCADCCFVFSESISISNSQFIYFLNRRIYKLINKSENILTRSTMKSISIVEMIEYKKFDNNTILVIYLISFYTTWVWWDDKRCGYSNECVKETELWLPSSLATTANICLWLLVSYYDFFKVRRGQYLCSLFLFFYMARRGRGCVALNGV